MPVWTVHAPPSAGILDPAEDVILIREGFSWRALIFAPLWALVHRLWLALLLWLAAVIIASLMGAVFGAVLGWTLLIGFLIWFGLEARDFRRAKLARRDWQLVNVVDAPTARLAELRFFQKLAAERAAPDLTRPALSRTPPQRADAFPPVIGFISGDRR